MTKKFPKNEKLKQSSVIEQLFQQGKSIYHYPIKLIYIENQQEKCSIIKLGVGVSKKNFKRAVDRNLLKRRMREAYRKNKPNHNNKSWYCMLLYTSKKIEPYHLIEPRIVACLEKMEQKDF